MKYGPYPCQVIHYDGTIRFYTLLDGAYQKNLA